MLGADVVVYDHSAMYNMSKYLDNALSPYVVRFPKTTKVS